MKKLFSLAIVVFLLSNVVYPQWKSSDIPDSLKRNADAVIRRYATDVKVMGMKLKITTVNKVITVLNEQGKDFADFVKHYDKNSRIESVKGILYNDLGKVVKKTKRSDFHDVSLTPDYTMYADNRMVYSEVYTLSYPFTIEYEYRIVDDNILSLPWWYPQVGSRLALENASLRISLVDSNMIKYKSFHLPQPTLEKDDGFSSVMIWEVNSLKALENEPFSPQAYNFLPAVLITPMQFVYQGYDGNMQTWMSYGKWVSSLLVGRQDLSAVAIENINKLTISTKDINEKVRIVYKYLQAHSRYISIQLGIGGFQPFAASDVEKYEYGDCKALTNYTQSLLSALNIKSYYCEMGINHARITFDDFPSINQTDHVLLCVPIDKDTVWLECTNQNAPYGYVSHSKQNQKAILINGDESHLVNLPRARVEKNVQRRVVHIELDSIGNAIGTMLTEESGAELENLFPEVWSNKKDQAEIVQKKYRIPGITYSSIEYQVDDNFEPTGSERIVFKVNGYASQTGRRLFIPFNPFSQGSTVPVKVKKRLRDVEIDESYTHIDTITYNIPNGFTIEYSPKPKSISGLFGSYNSSVNVDGDKLITIRKYTQNRGKYPAKEYNNFIDFLLEVSNRINKVWC